MLACRLCRVPISAAVGCAHCNPTRQNLVVVGEDEEDRPSLSGTAGVLVRSMHGQAEQVARDLKNNPHSAQAETRLLKLANTAAKLLESARKLHADGKSAVNNMSFAEQAGLFVTWYAALPPTYRSAVRSRFESFELEVSAPLPSVETHDN